MGAIKRILGYVIGMIDHGILYEHVQDFKPIGYLDSDWGELANDQRSTFGSLFTFNSGDVNWSSKK